MSLQRKFQRKQKKQPLSLLDKVLYICVILLGFVLGVMVIDFFGVKVPQKFAFADNNVVAYISDSSVVCCVPLCMVIAAAFATPATLGLEKKQPIFRNKKVKLSPFTVMIKTHPLFSKEFRENLTVKTVRKTKMVVLLFVVLILISAAIVPFGMYPRTVLDKDNNCITYDTFNEEIERINITEAEKTIINISYSRGYSRGGRRRGPSWGIQIIFVFENQEYRFGLGAFRELSKEEALQYMIDIKKCLGEGNYEIANTERMDDLIRKNRYTNAEKALIYELFEYKPQ